MAIDKSAVTYQSVYERWADDVQAAGVDPANPTEEAAFLLDMRLLLTFGPSAAFGSDMGEMLKGMSDEEMVALFSGEDSQEDG